jgi:transcriptional regulator with XRE-family HTH domain
MPNTIAARLRAYRSLHDITQEELARRLGCTARTVRRWEEGDASPTGLYKQAVERLIGREEQNTRHHPGCFPDGDDTSACHPDCPVRREKEGEDE